MTLLELLIVISLVSLVLGVGVGVLANLRLGQRAAHALVANVVRQAANSAVARQAPARVRIDVASGVLAAEATRVAGTWHFEDELLSGAFGLDGLGQNVELTPDGWIGKALRLGGSSLPGFARFGVRADPAFDLRDGFALELALRSDGATTGSLVDVGGAAGLELVSGGVLRAWLRPEISDESGHPRRGSRIVVDAPAGALVLGRWQRLAAQYDRSAFELSVDGLQVGRVALDAPVWQLEDDLVVGDARRRVQASVDALSVSVVVAGESVALPEGVTFTPETPRWIRFAPGGHLDRRQHAEPVQIGLSYDDGDLEVVRVSLYGTVE